MQTFNFAVPESVQLAQGLSMPVLAGIAIVAFLLIRK
jgi:hypothetical protein